MNKNNKKPSSKYTKTNTRRINRINTKFLSYVVGILMFGIFGSIFVWNSFALTPPPALSTTPPKPFLEEPERGLVWAGLKSNQNGVCGKVYEIRGNSGEVLGCTHGPDPAPAGVNILDSNNPIIANADTLNSNGVACIGDGISGSRVQMIYAYEKSSANYFANYATRFQEWGGGMQDAVMKSAQKTGGERYIRFVTNADCTLNVAVVEMSDTGLDTFSNMVNELRAQGYGNNDRKYVVWADALIYCGIGMWAADDTVGYSNYSNTGADYSRVDKSCWGRTDHYTELHELLHTLGAVGQYTPNATGNGHCTDESDIMCYPDASGVVMTYPCPTDQDALLDCGNNDYFNTNPEPNSYLANHWNIATHSLYINSCLNCEPPVFDNIPPSTPIGISALAADATQVNITWQASSDTGGSGLSGYNIFRNGAIIAKVNAGDTAYIDTTVQPSSTYGYQVQAYDNSGNLSNLSTSTSVTTKSMPDTTSPVITTITPSDGSTMNGAKVNISAKSSDNMAVTYMSIQIDSVLKATSSTGTISYNWNIRKVVKGSHTITYTAKDAAGNTSTNTITVYR